MSSIPRLYIMGWFTSVFINYFTFLVWVLEINAVYSCSWCCISTNRKSWKDHSTILSWVLWFTKEFLFSQSQWYLHLFQLSPLINIDYQGLLKQIKLLDIKTLLIVMKAGHLPEPGSTVKRILTWLCGF